jgi:hypothetical protein
MSERLAAEGMIGPADLDLLQRSDDPAEVVEIVKAGTSLQSLGD